MATHGEAGDVHMEADPAVDLDPGPDTGPEPGVAAELDDGEVAAAKARLLRKRTKTGCLTCRKRRIKCGEERPICKNCIKSKRHCEGYSQRVIFKPQTIDFRHLQNGAATITFPASTMGIDPNLVSPGLPYGVTPLAGLNELRPRPMVSLSSTDPYAQAVPLSAPAYQQSWPGGHPLEDANAQMQALQQMAMAQAQAQHVHLDRATIHRHVPLSVPLNLDRRQSLPDPFLAAAAYADGRGGATLPLTPGATSNLAWQQYQQQISAQAPVATPSSNPPLSIPGLEHNTPSWTSGTSSMQPPTPLTAPLLSDPWSGQIGPHPSPSLDLTKCTFEPSPASLVRSFR